MRFALLASVLAVVLAGCQSPEQSMDNAETVCLRTGLKPGTARYNRCIEASYENNRRNSEQATNAAVIGAAAGVIGGAAIASSRNNYYYGRPYYYRCRGWGC